MSTAPECVEAFDLAALNAENRGLRLSDPDVSAQAEALLDRLSLEQKVRQMSGLDYETQDDLYLAPGAPSLGIPEFRMVDGPRGVRAKTATAFPVAMARGATWNPALEAAIGQAIAREARARGANVLLAPAVNLLRHPGWGRAQETYGEDPLHVGCLGAAFIAGAQRELVACVKHFALNSIEDNRFEVDVQVDARTLHEVYLPHFERCVRDAHVGAVMSAYNRVNGQHCAENGALLRGVLKEGWGFQGLVMSDWVFGTRSTEPSLRAGLDLEMPAPYWYGERLLAALRQGRVDARLVDEAVLRALRVKLAFGLTDLAMPTQDCIECHAHQELALRAAHESMVLLKNEGGLLPLDAQRCGRVAVVGSLAALENTGDHGSSAVSSSFVVSALEGLTDRLSAARVLQVPTDALSASERRAIAACDVAVVIVGLTWQDEGERIPLMEGGGDRTSLRLRPVHEQLIRDVCALVPRTIVVLQGGSALEVRPWVDRVPALLMSWYPGMLGGEALADVLFGRVCPSGKLPLSFARSAADLVPFDPRAGAVRYGYDHGYRYLDRLGREVEFPFGFGLSYTRFRYDALVLDRSRFDPDGVLEAEVQVTNVGARAGEEVVQLYVTPPPGDPVAPLRSLVGFGRLALGPSESKRLRMRVTQRELRTYDATRDAFRVRNGSYVLSAGPSSRELPLRASFTVA